MPLAFSTTDNGDVILRTHSELDSVYDFHVHKIILSLASPVFSDMFSVPQPADRTTGEHQLQIIDTSDHPEVLDTLLQLIYPGVEPPIITNLSTVKAVLSAADKYNITSLYPVLRGYLKTFLPTHPFEVYVVACRFGFREEAKEAARVANTRSILCGGTDEVANGISTIDLLRFTRFVQERENKGRSIIGELFGDWGMDPDCNHWDDGKDFYFHLGKAVEDAFALNPCVGMKDLLVLLNKVPDPPAGCEPATNSAEWCEEECADHEFDCPLRPMSIRERLSAVAGRLSALTSTMLEGVFKE